MKGKSTTAAIFALRQLQERYREGQQELHCVFIDLEKTYDRVSSYIRTVLVHARQGCVKEVTGTSEPIAEEVGLQQESALSPFLFAIMMDSLTENIRKEAPRQMMFADDVVLCAREKDVLELELEQCRMALEYRGMKVSRAKTDYMCLNGTRCNLTSCHG